MSTSVYFFIWYPRDSKVNDNDIQFVVSDEKEIKPECIFTDLIFENKEYKYKKVFKVDKSAGKGKKGNDFNFEFEIKDERYIISFDIKSNTFVYDVILQFGKRRLSKILRKINQSVIEYPEKMSYFEKALEKNGEENKIDDLVKETIDLYSRKKGFSLLITLFLNVYKNKDLCPSLLKIFREMNGNPKDNEKNMDRKDYLKDYTSIFKKIIESEAAQLITNNKYNPIEFYGIILSYLNYYDYDNFCKAVKEFKNSEDLYEILLIYIDHFKNPINEDSDFFNAFMEYAILNKEFSIFQKGLNYIKDLDTFINVIEKNKENFYNRYFKSNDSKKNEKYILKLDEKLKIKNTDNSLKIPKKEPQEQETIEIIGEDSSAKKFEEKANNKKYIKDENNPILKIIKKIESIINYSKMKKIFIIYFTNEFWKELLKINGEPDQDTIYICFKLRETFIKYYELVKDIFGEKKKFTIKSEAYNYYQMDEFAFILDQMVRKFIESDKTLKNIEKLGYIKEYNPYYIEEKYHSRVEPEIFNTFDLNSIDNHFIEDFRSMNFENIFKENMNEYINKLMSKIKTIANFDIIIKLININNIAEKSIFLYSLNKKYDIIIKPEIGILTGEELNEANKVVARIALLNFNYEEKDEEKDGKKDEGKDKKFNFINNKIKKLNKDIIPLIYIEIIKICIENENKEKKEGEDDEKEDKDSEKNEIQSNSEENNFDYQKMKDFIFEEFTKKLENNKDIDNIINLLDFLDEKFKNEKNGKKNESNEFLKKLMKNHLFTKEEFFSNNENLKISLLYKLYKKDKINNDNKEEDYYQNIFGLLNEIRGDIDGNIEKKKLDEFLKNEESVVKERLSLIKIILDTFDPDKKYEDLKKQNEVINEFINHLIYIKDNIIIYYKESEQDLIKKLIETIKDNKNKKISQYKGGKIKEIFEDTNKKSKLEDKANKINKVKDFLLFNVIYDLNAGKDEDASFNNSYYQLEEIGNLLRENVGIIQLYNKDPEIFDIIKKDFNGSKENAQKFIQDLIEYFDKIKEKLSNSEERAQKFIQDLIKYYEIDKNNNKNLIDELTILFKSKKYELDINSMIFFFSYFEKNNELWNNKLSEKYKNLSSKDFTEIKDKLLELKNNKIYDYQNVQNYNEFFTCLYEKKEAIEFLFSKTSKEIAQLKDRIQPTDRTISINDIIDTEQCNIEISKMVKIKDNDKIFSFIQTMNKRTIKQFENYSKIYESVIELDRNDEDSDNLYEQVITIIKDATFNIEQDSEKFLYIKDNKNENITKDELFYLKNRIHIKNENENVNINQEQSNGEDKLKNKRKILIFYKEIISNLKLIIDYMDILRNKGSSLPIKIKMEIKVNNDKTSIKYKLHKEEIKFNNLLKFLFNAKTSYISQLNEQYKIMIGLRFLYGKQFRTMMRHLENDFNLDSFLRYILNNTDNNTKINIGYKSVSKTVKDYIKHYDRYNQDSLKIISDYINSLFEKNDKTIESHYNNMRIIPSSKVRGFSINDKGSINSDKRVSNFDKGIYLYECNDISMEKVIINLFWDKIRELPIAQNVLITNKETSIEEIQAYFHRAILCNFNTLFVVEINDSFDEYQQSKMNNYIDSILSYKNQNFNEDNNANVDKKNTKDYLESCIVFVYDKKNNNMTSFLKEIGKLEAKYIMDDKINQIKLKDNEGEKNNDILKELGNTIVITSEICGLGKSEKIKKMIKDKNQKYYHFPIGGILTKEVIYDKLNALLNKIKDENCKEIAIHLDLTESKEKSIINEFFFSFLVTKFYANNENIIYIPKDISIYIEIPNCFEDYLKNFGILNIFKREHITFENMPPFNYPNEMITIFNRMLGINSNEKMQKWVKEHINIPKYSYHQINIFIKLFISQYNKFKTKITFLLGKEDVTEVRINQFALCTQYFTNGGFAQLLTGIEENANKEKDYIDKISNIYDNDLHREFPTPLIFIIKEKMIYDRLYIPTKETNDYKSPKDYLKRIKEILNLKNEVDKDVIIDGIVQKSLLSIIEEKNNNYVITNDNFKKMVLLVYRIKANVPVIIMGDTGCGKTALITKLNQLLNNGETTVETINIHPGITDEKLCERMKKLNEKAELILKKNEEENKIIEEENKKIEKENEKIKKEKGNPKDLIELKNDEVWIFFDEMNTCLSMSLLTEIFINRTFNGNKLCENIRLIGACNPYRKRKENKEKCGLSKSGDNENELVYLVEPLPQSLLYYVFSFGSIDENDEKKYIHSIIEKNFNEDEKKLHEITRDAISQCHIYLRDTFDASVVSLREIARFTKCLDFFMEYFTKKNQYLKRVDNYKNNKLRSIICSIYLCYYIRLTDDDKRTNFEFDLRPILIKLLLNGKDIAEGKPLLEQIQIEEFSNEITKNDEDISNFSDFLRIEEEFILDQIELDKGIGKNTLLKENVFLLFLAVKTNIPLIIIGKPGTGKSLSAQLIYKSMRGKYSKNKFFQLFPQLIQIYFQGSESNEPEDVENLFDKAKMKLNHFIKENEKLKEKGQQPKELPIIMVLFDELGLAERSKKNALKVLHSKLEYSGKDEGVSFIGISNYSLDAAKINRALVLSVPDLDQRLDELITTSSNIVESISEKLAKDQIFEILSKTYFDYKNALKFIKELIVYKNYKIENNEEQTTSIDNVIQAQNEKSTNDATKDVNEQNKSFKEDSESNTIISTQKEISTNEKKEKGQFNTIKKKKEFITLYKKEKKIKIDFHGNRDFYNLIKGIAIELRKLGDLSNEDKVQIIIKYIERNFGGIDYEIDIDFKSTLDDIRKELKNLKDILMDYNLFEEEKPFKVTSIFLFKRLYNSQFENDPSSSLKIDKNKINDYNLNSCINDNIRDFNSRYLLLQVRPSLTTLIYQNIKLQNPFRDIILYDGSSFPDDNNKEYRFRKINQIQDDAQFDKIVVLENLNQIHPFLFDLYNRNYIIKDEKKFVRICLENANEQLTLVHDRFKIIILFDKRYIDQCELALLNRLEKMNLSFGILLDNKLKKISDNIIKELRFRNIIEKYKNVNFSLKDLLINCGNEDIQGLIYYLSKELNKKENDMDNEEEKEEFIDENQIKEKVISKLYKILPQDIICILPDNNIIKARYNDLKNINNFRDYIRKEYKEKDENTRYKISIIYTFTSFSENVDGEDKGMKLMISEIRSEDGLKSSIEEIKKQNEINKPPKDYYICIHFQQSNSKMIKFISNYILNNFNDQYIYIFIIHINRNFQGKKGERINSLPDINPSINQIFIDDLNCNNNIKLNDLLTQDIKDILKNKKDDLKLDEELNKALTNFINKELSDKYLSDDNNEYLTELENYLNDSGNEAIKEKIMEKTYKLIDDAKDEDANCKGIIKEMYEHNYITKYTLDITSCLINYIKESIFNKYLKKVFLILEDNNIFTTLLENIKNNFKYINKNLIEKIIIKYLDTEEKKDEYNSKFLYNYNVPGFYNFYLNISNYINKNISINYSNNEKKLRELLKENVDIIKEFYDKEGNLLSNVYEEISKNHKFVLDIIDKIPEDLIFKDYITFYLQKYKNKDDIYNKDDKYHKLIELIIKLRFSEEKKIVKDNQRNKINILLLKIMWMESNINYILNIFNIFDNALIIYNDNQKILLENIEEVIFKEKIKYIINEKKNPKHTKEVNDCYYIILASICYCITSDDIKLVELIGNKKNDELEIEISYYCYLLTQINKILQKLSDDLYIFLYEMYIIDELIQIIELFKKSNKIEKINEIKKNLRENAFIIQEYSSDNNNDSLKLSEELCKKFEELYKLIMDNGKIIRKDKIFYDKVRYIFFKEIRKTLDINYRFQILEKVLEENEMIKKSNDIFQLLLKNYLKTDKFKENYTSILNGDDIIIKLIEQNLRSNNLVLAETLLYLFEKNSMIYLNNILNNKKVEVNLEDEPLEVLQECIKFLEYYIVKPKTVESKLKETAKLFCLGYLKVYIYIFIKMFDEEKSKCKDPKKIIKVFNGDNAICKMARIFLYKILYHNYRIDVFIDNKSVEKFKLKEYNDFTKLIKNKELINIYKIDYKIKTLKDGYNDAYKAIEKYKNKDFKNKIKEDDFDLEEYGIDNFYVISYNLVLSNLQMDNSKGNDNFYNNICEPLFKNKKLLEEAIQFFYNPSKYKEIKEHYKIDSKNIKPILFGYRYLLNEICSKNTKGIYYPLYDGTKLNYLREKFYPGNETKYISTYSDVINHFKSKPEEGCYVCLCDKSYYHSIPSGFPGIGQLDMICPGCKKNIGSIKKGNDIISVKRENYYRILKDENEIEEIKNNRIKKDKLKYINYMTLDKFKERYINQSNERGIYIGDKNSFINDMKIIRNLSQISYRILNYILYINLFFVRIITDKDDLDRYLPKGMEWTEIINECWNFIKNELLKENIYSIDEFMNYLFVELFPILNSERNIDDYKDLIKLEDKLESTIQKIIKNYKEEGYKNESNEKESDNEKTSLINLLKEKYSKGDYKIEDYPFYEYFYYTYYLDIEYISKKLEQMYENKYPILRKYIENKNNNDNNKYKLEYLHLFNSVLNLISENYFNKISREYAEKNKLKDEEIYINNKELIDKFISFYNGLDMKDNNKKALKLSKDNCLGDFFIDNNNSFGMTYKTIYHNFIKAQNEKLESLLDIKIEKDIFDKNCKSKISIQQVNEKDIFTLQLPKKVSIIDILFNSSYRKILDSEILSNKSYKEYEINYDNIEENMTDLLLKNKKLLNEDIIEFVYNNEVFSVQLNGLTAKFSERYNSKNIIIHDKVAIYQFTEENNGNVNLIKNMINDFITLIKFLNDKRREQNKDNEIKEENKIYELINKNLKTSVHPEFIQIFQNNDGLTIDKASSCFDYYLATIYEDIKKELDEYQEEINENSKNAIDKYYEKKDTIPKKDFAYAIRLFETLVLFQENDKENKIKSNHNNLVNYLKADDFWTKDIYASQDFSKNLNELKLCNVEINQSASLYEYLGKDIKENYFDEVKKAIENKESKNKAEKKIQEEENIDEDDPFAQKPNKEEGEEEDPFGDNKGGDDSDDNDGDRN